MTVAVVETKHLKKWQIEVLDSHFVLGPYSHLTNSSNILSYIARERHYAVKCLMSTSCVPGFVSRGR